jgi:large subunit ribosomal protein L25
MTEKLRVDIPVELVGEPEGVTQQGGVLEHLIREIEVESLPADILEVIEVDVSKLMIGDTITVRDIGLDTEKYTIITAPDVAVTAVAAPRVVEEEVPAEEELAEVEEGAEPEVIGEKEREEAKKEQEKEQKDT